MPENGEVVQELQENVKIPVSKVHFLTPTEPTNSLEQAMHKTTETPIPKQDIVLDQVRADTWVAEEEDPQLQGVRRELVEQVQFIQFKEFNTKLQSVVGNLMTTLQEDGQQYAVLWDYKPHGSKRWVTELSRDAISSYPPTVSSYFETSFEQALALPTVTAMLDQGINRFIVMDDAIYSGEQVMNKIIIPIVGLMNSSGFQKQYPDRQIKIILAVPYISNRFLEDPYVQQLRDEGILEITEGYEEMKTLDTTLSQESLSTIKRYGGRISSDPEADVFYMPPAYAFNHRVPDSHSFPEELRQVIADIPQKPYSDDSMQYYKLEEEDFAKYDTPIREAWEKHRAIAGPRETLIKRSWPPQ